MPSGTDHRSGVINEKADLATSVSVSGPSAAHEQSQNKLEEGDLFDSHELSPSATWSGVEEKRLLRRIDWRLLPLLAAMYVVKTIDAQNVSRMYDCPLCRNIQDRLNLSQVSNARAMDKKTPYNIMIELNMTSDEYNLVTVAYYVRLYIYS